MNVLEAEAPVVSRNAHEKLHKLIETAQKHPPMKVAVAHPCDQVSLESVAEAARLRLIEPILVGPEQHVAALEPPAVKGDHHLGLAPLVQLVRPPVPDAHRSGAVGALGNHALEVEVLDRMVADMERRTTAGGVECRTLGYRPAEQHTVGLETEVVVVTCRPMPLHDEARQIPLVVPLRHTAPVPTRRSANRAGVDHPGTPGVAT